MDPQQLDLHPPKNWQDFQDLCHALWELEWVYPAIQKNGRTGQKQRGVDIFGIPESRSGFWGVQCKVKSIDAARNPELTEDEVIDEVNQAKAFVPPLEHLIIATTAPEDAKIQSFARVLSEEHVSKGLFRIDVLAWPEIQARLAKHEALIERFYPGVSAQWKQLSEQVTETRNLGDRSWAKERHAHLSVNAVVLLAITSLPQSEKLERLISGLSSFGGADADLGSHVSVALDFIDKIWSTKLSHVRQARAVGLVLEKLSLLLGRHGLLENALKALLRDTIATGELHGYLRQWIRGHFLRVE